MTGLKLAALYSYSPARLGFCGARTKNTASVLLDFICGKEKSLAKVKKILKSFEASYPYYKLIAQANGIKNPFDYRVVGAYWLGNELLEKVKPKDLKKLILNEFARPGLLTKKQAAKKASLVFLMARPHHSFHVFFIGSITGRVILTHKLLDVCRVNLGKVIKTESGLKKLTAEYRPLVFKNKKCFLGKPVDKEIVWDKRFIPKIKVGDVVSFHWGRVCQVLTKSQQKNLLKYTKLTLKAISGRRR